MGGGAGIGVGVGTNNGGYWGGTGGYNGGGGYGTGGVGTGYYDQYAQQQQAQMALMGQNQAIMSRNQGNAIANQMGAQAIQTTYQNAYNDLYSMGGAGYYGGTPYSSGNMGSIFGVSGGISASFGL
jgi:hypothetical protein